jgi:transcriptional regulator with PAS, ATPase and Fis domain
MDSMIILTDSQVVELNNRIGQIQRLIESAQVIKASGAVQPKAVTEQAQPQSVTSKRRKAKRKTRGALDAAKVVEIKRRLATGEESAQKIANDYGVHVTTVNLIKYGKTWKSVQVPA